MTYPIEVAHIISYSATDKQVKRRTFHSKEEHVEFIQSMPSNEQLIEHDEEAIEKALNFDAPLHHKPDIFDGSIMDDLNRLVEDGKALAKRRKEPVLQQHFEQLGFDLGLMDKPNES